MCATTTSSVVAANVRFQAVAKASSTAGIRRWVQSFVATPLIWDDEEVCDDDVANLVYFSAEGRTMGALEARSEHFVDLSGTGPQEQVRRSRAASALRLTEREEISRGIAAGLAIRAIARRLGRSPSTVCREISRNGGAQAYRAIRADKHAWERALRPKQCRLACNGRLRWRVAQKLALQWSPEQIAGWLRHYADDPNMRISHEAIYRSLFIQSRGVLKKELTAHLRTRRQMRLAKGAQTQTGQGQILDMVYIRERPAEAEDRAVPGHWEGDLLTGANDTHIATLVERHSRFTMLVKLKKRDSATVVAALAQQIGKLPEELRRSLTWDQGKEMARHQSFTVATDVCLLLRSAQSLAARQQRKYQLSAQAILPERNQPLPCLAGQTQRRCPAPQSTA